METGERGEGGDRTLEIDAAAERAVFSELERLHGAGARFTVVSEERGTVDYDGDGTLVIVDPIDGSMNAKRGMVHHALSIAVAEGPTMADVVFGFVYDIGPGEEWVAERGAGATLGGQRLDPSIGERRTRAGKLELVGIESADPRWVREAADALVETSHRLRAMGDDRGDAVPGRRGAAGRNDDAAQLPRGRRGGGPADRPRGRRPRRLHRLRRPARRPARPRAALARGRRAHARGAARARERAAAGAQQGV